MDLSILVTLLGLHVKEGCVLVVVHSKNATQGWLKVMGMYLKYLSQ